jgi:hypothetical protein
MREKLERDCHGISDKVGCWLYDPEQGICPFLTGQIATKDTKKHEPHESS